MKSVIIFCISFFLAFHLFGQTDFKGDSIPNHNFSRLSYLIDSAFKLDKTFDFEFRLSTNPSLISYANVFILRLKNKIWTARFFEYHGNRTNKLSETKINQTGLDNLWKNLVANQALTLPTQDSIKNKMRLFVADTSLALEDGNEYRNVIITDGVVYHFELSTRGKTRSYDYQCPQGYLKYCPNVEELYRAFVIIIMVRKYLGLNLTVC
jgi:hypothetical protein